MTTTIAKTIKLQFKPKKEDVHLLKEHLEVFRQAANYVSRFVFNKSFKIRKFFELNELLYYKIRDIFNLKAQATQNVLKMVVARYKTTEKQLQKEKVFYGMKKDKKVYKQKSLEYTSKPIFFRKPQADLVRNRDYRFKENFSTITLTISSGLVDVKPINIGFYKEYFTSEWKMGTAKMLEKNGKWFLHIPVTREVEDFDIVNTTGVVGIDRGLRQIVTTYDQEGKTTFVNGKKIAQKRKKYARIIQSLQKRNTRNAKRRIRKMDNRENRWMSNVNHCLSKALVNQYPSGMIFALENLEGVQFATENLSKENKHQNHSWSFYQLEQFMSYKAEEINSKVVKFDAHYTSQRCPKCGDIDKENRNHHLHLYTCKCCGYKSNDDRIGAMNVYQLGVRFAEGEENPSFKKEKELIIK